MNTAEDRAYDILLKKLEERYKDSIQKAKLLLKMQVPEAYKAE
jgi:hypothetical protein